jgi:predicted Ser/Thr protein kinase
VPNAQDHAFALLVTQRGGVTPVGFERARALLAQRGAGQTLAQAMLETGVLNPAAVAEVLRELARSSFTCTPCHELRPYDALAPLAKLECPSCGRPLSIVATTARDSRLSNTFSALALEDTFAGGAPPKPQQPPGWRPSGQFVVPARASGSFDTRPSGAADVRGLERVIGPYTVVRELGRGSNGVVYLARRAGLERDCAVKVLLRGDAVDAEGVERFKLEATIASKIEDPGVIRVFDVGRHGAQHYYAMEYCPGVTLEDRLKRGPLPPLEAATLVEKLARTLQAAHHRAVIHRDLKPANVILEEGSGRPRILDFGLAVDRSRVMSLTRSGDIVGTPYYMAPEQINGDRDLDHRIDVYALGVILYQCLTGRRPFEASTVVDLAQKIKEATPPAPRSLVPEVPPRLEAICLKAMARERDRRHPSARHLAEALAAFVDEQARIDQPEPTPRRGGAPPSRVRWAAAMGGGAVALVALGAALHGLISPAGAPTPPSSEAPVVAPPTVTSASAAERVEGLLERARALSRQRASEGAVLAELERALEAAADDPALAARAQLAQAAFLSRRARYARALALTDALAGASGPIGAEASRLAAHAHERLLAPGPARAAWARAAELDPHGPPGLTAAAALARLDGEPARHRDRAERAALDAPGYAPALLELASAQAAAAELPKARESARAAAAVWPDDAAVHLVVGLLDEAAGELPAARAAVDEAVRLAEPEPEVAALIARARLSVGEGRLEATLGDLDRVLQHDADHVEALVLRGVALWALSAVGEASARRAAAEDAWRRAHGTDAGRFLQLVDSLTPQVRAAARQAAGVSLTATASDAAAPFPLTADIRARLERWVQPLEPAARVPLLRALVAAAEGRPLAACEEGLREAKAAAPGSAAVAHLRARVLAGRDAYGPAMEEIARARTLGGPRGALDLLEGEVLWFQGRGNDGVKVWDELARREPTAAEGLCAAAWSHYARQEIEPALRMASEALRRAPELVSALVVEGIAHEWEERDAKAEACYERALALEGAIFGRVALFELDAELDPMIRAVGWKGASTPEIDARMERLEALFGLGGATARIVAVNNGLELGPGTRWFGRCHPWLDDAQKDEPLRGELDMWHGWIALHERETKVEVVLAHWRRAKEKEPRIVLSAGMRETFKRRFGDHPALAEFPER